MTVMGTEEPSEWGIWYSGGGYTVGHFLKTLGPESKVWRFPTRQAAMQIVEDRWASSRYQPRKIPSTRTFPEHH